MQELAVPDTERGCLVTMADHETDMTEAADDHCCRLCVHKPVTVNKDTRRSVRTVSLAKLGETQAY